MAARRRGVVRLRRKGLRERAFERAILHEIARIRKLLELDDTAYSDLAVMARAREELEAIADDQYEEAEEAELEDE